MSSAKDIILAVTPTVTGCISLVASSIIISKIHQSKTKLQSPYNRMLFGLSGSGVIYSICCMCSTYVSPKGTPGVWGSVGNETTCQIQGFLILISIASAPFYNCALCIYYLCVIRYSMRDERFSTKIEPLLHAVPFCWGWFSAIYFLSHGLINNAAPGIGCWIAPYPSDCIGNPDVDCIRGENIDAYRGIFHLSYRLIMLFIITVTMSMILWSVWKQELRMNQYRFQFRSSHYGSASGPQSATSTSPTTGRSHTTPRRHRSSLNSRTKSARTQAILYCGAFLLANAPPYAMRLVVEHTRVGEHETIRFASIFLYRFLNPLQGLFNMVAFIWPHVVNVRRDNPDVSYYIKAFIVAIQTLDLDQRTETRNARRMRRRSSRMQLANLSAEPESPVSRDSFKLFCDRFLQNEDENQGTKDQITVSSD